MPKVSVLIPVYGVEKYIARCAKSLFEQTLEDIEYVFVNDCTTDDSINKLKEVIANYPNRKNQVKIIDHTQNKGLAAARNTGITAASGEYFIHCDSDDWVEPNMYEEMYLKAIEENSDIVSCDFWRDRALHSRYRRQEPLNDPHEFIKSIFSQKNHASNCTKLIRRSFYISNNLNFIEGLNMWEDVLMSSKTFFYAKKISHINKAYYHYDRSNSGSIVHSFSQDSLNQLVAVAQEIEKFYEENHALGKFQDSINNLKIFIKYLHFRRGDKIMSKKAITLYSELNNSIFSSAFKPTRKLKLWMIIKFPPLLPFLKKI